MSHRGVYRKGDFLVGASYSADVAARAEVQRKAPARGDFITAGGGPVAYLKAVKRFISVALFEKPGG